MTKKLLFSVGIKDCRVDTFRGSGKGGQKKQKTSSGIRITHIASRAVGRSTDSRYQHVNKKTAFRKMCESKAFKIWIKVESAKRLGMHKDIELEVSKSMKQVKVETRNDQGDWIEGLTE